MKIELYTLGFLIVFILCSLGLSYVVITSKKFTKKDKIKKLLLIWLLPYIGFFIVFFSFSDSKKNIKDESIVMNILNSGDTDPFSK